MSNTSDISNSSIPHTPNEFTVGMAEIINDYLGMYYTPVLVCLGCIGNVLSVFVFFRTKLRKLSSSYYLSALAISDTIFLLSLLIMWLNFYGIRISNEPGMCQLLVYASGASSCMSVWSVVAFTVERFVAVLYPLRRQAVCTVARARAVLCGLIALALLHSAPLLLFSQPIYKKELNATICDVAEDYREAASVFNTLDTVVAFLVPLTIIVVLNSCTACAVWRLAGIRRSMTVTGRGGSRYFCEERDALQGIPFPGTTTVCKLRRKKPVTSNSCSSQMKVTKMLLIVSTVFVCLNLPSYVMRLRAFIEHGDMDLGCGSTPSEGSGALSETVEA
ncbi:somatostatin receptor type 4-like [Ctenocephalides felis]|uniref:somatostatin receptor type 4-like n=1 Tax=Ctenocephalides felis TaxID=7515 RepID=UPI000E6E4A70|nr:somatostatin receptor type 4-like [Ctenocephalides felis]